MPTNTFILLLFVYAAALIGGMVILMAAHRWQRSVWRREMGQRVEGFEVKPTDRPEE